MVSKMVSTCFSVSVFCIPFLAFSFKLAMSAAIDEEIDALLALKSGLQDPLGNLDNWVVAVRADNGNANYSISPCQWRGVRCNASAEEEQEGTVVSSLDLSSMNLSGSLSQDIGRLQNVAYLSLAVNNLTGRLPLQITEIGSSLRYLNISNNLFAGPFPSQNVSNLSGLEVLDAYNNNFTGPLPLEISKLSRLRHLHLGGNYFDGGIPPQYGNMQNLVYLALSGNSLTGRIPVELGNLGLLQELYLGYYNMFDGGIPPAFGCLSKLMRLDMANCGLTGTIPRQFQNLTKLDTLFLQINSLSGNIPAELGGMVGLTALDLSNNMLSGEIPLELSKLHNLSLLNLFRNQLHGTIPPFIGNLPSLQELSLWENNMTGSVPQHLGLNGRLVIVDFSSNSFSGPIPGALCFGGNLERLILFNNFFTGPIPQSLASCGKLVRLRLGYNELSGAIPEGLLNLPMLQYMEAPSNLLHGSIPFLCNTFTISKLGRLDLSDNHITGPIPQCIGRLSVLQTLLLPGNAISGMIPDGIGDLGRLAKLDCNGNAIGGSIPASLGKCGALTYLDLSRNDLVGQIPSELQNLSVLDFLNVSKNHLSGAIPSSLQQLQSLTSADFSYNNLSGVIPAQGQFATFNVSSFIGNENLCGAQINLPCIDASTSSSLESARSAASEPALVYWVIVGVISSLTVLVFVVGVICNRHAFYALLGRETLDTPWKLTAYQKLDFTVAEVLNCLSDDNIIGKGGSGTVYKCATPSGYVAVKRFPRVACISRGSNFTTDPGGSSSDDHGFSAEIQTLGKIRHRNIVRLLGWCSSRDVNLLVYEYMPNGSLGELLHGPRGGNLDWAKRYRIAVEAANGLRYLHHDCNPLIVHRDVKSNNILLDSKFEAHVADFGLAKAMKYPESMSLVAGSYGYIAPEYVYTLKVDEKSDIYSFGVVLLELLAGRRPFEQEFGEGVDIVAWVRTKMQMKDGVLDVLDPRLGIAAAVHQHQQQQTLHPQAPSTDHSSFVRSYSSSSSAISALPAGALNRQQLVAVMQEVMVVMRVAMRCLEELPMERPTMREVVQMLTDVPRKKTNAGVNIESDKNNNNDGGLQSRTEDDSLSKVKGTGIRAVPLRKASPPDLISI